MLERLLKAAEAQKRTGSVIEILVAQALAHQVQGNLPLALASLERALTLAEPEGYLRLFVDEGEPMRLLLLGFDPHLRSPGQVSRIEKQSSGQGHRLLVYVEKLLSAFERAVEKQPMNHPKKPELIEHKVRPAKDMLVEPLSERELEVLRLLRTDLNGPEIAREFMVSLNTIRTHTQNIYAKLGVNNRRAAVRRAEELDLL